jgi:L-lactate dehydrogenase
MPDVAGVADVTLALPHLIGAQGSLGTLPLPLDEPEWEALKASAGVIKQAIEALQKPGQ